ncbi:carbohydrate binding family 9 domain-containing protein [bacterium]|nr:carbohydrate binding family 9 domain-containing protein [bacterium]
MRALILLFFTFKLFAQNPVELPTTQQIPKLDGVLNDDVWQQAFTINDFVQRLPHEGQTPSEKTEVFLLYTSTDLYVGVKCYDSKPDHIAATVMQRDNFDLTQNEQFVIAIDSYNDGRSGFWFSTNPLGVRVDAQFNNEGDVFIVEWDGIWDVQAHSDSDGWSAELRIPFSTLRFKSGSENIMGINLYRRIIRTNEHLFSPLIPLQYANGTPNVSIARKFLFKNIVGNKRWFFKPTIITSHEKNYIHHDSKASGDLGLDLTYALSDNMVTTITYNTDFSQVEADDRQINLSRFNIFIPEKRDFFIENSALFAFGLTQEAEVFFSRRIGLAADTSGQLFTVPILAGGKMTGKIGRFDIGILNVQTQDRRNVPDQNFSVVRMKYEILPRSYIGLIGTRKDPAEGRTNSVVGIDGNVFLNETVAVSAFAVTSKSAVDDPGSSMYNAAIYRGGEREAFNFSVTSIGRNFDPQMGFLVRSDTRKWYGDVKWPVYLKHPVLRRFVPEYETTYYENPHDRIENYFHKFNFTTELVTDDIISVFIKRNFEYIPSTFPIFRTVEIENGNYHQTSGGLSLSSKPGRRLSGTLSLSGGGFYGGSFYEIGSSLLWKWNYHLTLSQDYTTTFAKLDNDEFRTHIAQTRINYAFNTRFFIASLIQYDNASNELGFNIRVNYLLEEGRELFVVYNHLFDQHGVKNVYLKEPVNRSLILKFSYLF